MTDLDFNQRINYAKAHLIRDNVADDPFTQFGIWFDEAITSNKLTEPQAMTLATADAEGLPSARIVLLRGFDARGFVFYTNYNSQKGRDLAANPQAALSFYWAPLERQIRIVGSVDRLKEVESDAYFDKRPRGSQLGAWSSPQSEPIPSRTTLDDAYALYSSTYTNQDVPRPPYWGGYRVVPHSVEFWQGRPNRLHDRLRYRREMADKWSLERIAP